MTHCKGHTLIEVLIIIGLVALLALAASPFTGAWVKSADIAKVQGDLTQAMGRAKAIALRNATGSLNSDPVAAVCIAADNTLTLRQATPAQGATPAQLPGCSPVAGTQVWSTTLDSDVDVTFGDPQVAVSCLCFDNKGLLTSEAQCAGCTTTSTFILTAGTENDTVQIY